jgi:hypothetical protein
MFHLLVPRSVTRKAIFLRYMVRNICCLRHVRFRWIICRMVAQTFFPYVYHRASRDLYPQNLPTVAPALLHSVKGEPSEAERRVLNMQLIRLHLETSAGQKFLSFSNAVIAFRGLPLQLPPSPREKGTSTGWTEEREKGGWNAFAFLR